MSKGINYKRQLIGENMKNTMKLVLTLAILTTGVFAGDQGNGGRNCDPNDPASCCDPTQEQCGSAAISEEPSMAFATMFVIEEVLESAAGYGR